MLNHLADTIEAEAPQRGGETYRDEMVDALRHGAEIVRDRHVNLMHVAQIWDEKVAQPVPPLEPRVDSGDIPR